MVKDKKIKKAERYEMEKARAHGGKPLGGPGKPDYQRGTIKGEVKDWSRPVYIGIIKKAIKDGVKEIEAKNGFTEPALKLAKQHGIKLFQRGRRIN
jgi:hypothetical protein